MTLISCIAAKRWSACDKRESEDAPEIFSHVISVASIIVRHEIERYVYFSIFAESRILCTSFSFQ